MLHSKLFVVQHGFSSGCFQGQPDGWPYWPLRERVSVFTLTALLSVDPFRYGAANALFARFAFDLETSGLGTPALEDLGSLGPPGPMMPFEADLFPASLLRADVSELDVGGGELEEQKEEEEEETPLAQRAPTAVDVGFWQSQVQTISMPQPGREFRGRRLQSRCFSVE